MLDNFSVYLEKVHYSKPKKLIGKPRFGERAWGGDLRQPLLIVPLPYAWYFKKISLVHKVRCPYQLLPFNVIVTVLWCCALYERPIKITFLKLIPIF